MVWNRNLPSGTKPGNLIDDDSQANNLALETGLANEHTLATGGDQDLRHKFKRDTQANIAAVSEFVDGAVAIATDVCTDPVWSYYDGSDWWHALEPYLSNVNDWAAGQILTQDALTPAASLASDWADSNIFTVTLDQDSTLANPTSIPAAGKGGVWYYIIKNDSTARTLAYGSAFTVDGVATSVGPTIDPAINSITVIRCVLDATGALIMTSGSYSRFATDEEAAAGTVADQPLTPDNLGQNFEAAAAAGHLEIIGTEKLVQWIRVAVAGGGASQVVTFETAFADTSYTAVVTYDHTSSPDQAIAVTITSTTQMTVFRNSGATLLHILAIGDKPAP